MEMAMDTTKKLMQAIIIADMIRNKVDPEVVKAAIVKGINDAISKPKRRRKGT
jgi:hypothetical protein